MLKVNYGDGEQFWKLWLTNVVCGVQIRVATKRNVDDTFAVDVTFVDMNRDVRKAWGANAVPTEADLDRFVEELIQETEDKRLKFRCLDLSAYKRFDQFVHAISESTQWRVEDLMEEGVDGTSDP